MIRRALVATLVLVVAACESEFKCLHGEVENAAGNCECPLETHKQEGKECVPLVDSGSSASTAADGSVSRDAGLDARSPWMPVGQGDAGELELDAGAPDAIVGDASDSGLLDAAVDAAPACVPSTEICNGKDDDCDTLVDEEVSEAPIGTACNANGQGACAVPGKYVCVAGAPVCNVPVMPQAEVCDGIDNDCMNGVDDTFPEKGMACTVGEGACANTGVRECDPTDPTKLRCSVAPKTPTCGSSCAPMPTTECFAGTGDCKGTAAWVCDSAASAWVCPAAAKPVTCAATGTCSPLPPETCGDGIDNDCKNGVDDGCGPAIVNWYKDCDGDGFAKSIAGAVPSATMPAPTTDCLGWTSLKPDEATHTNWDCSDSGGANAPESAKYHPGADFNTPSTWVTSFDFNCDGVNTMGTQAGSTRLNCSDALIAYYNANGNCGSEIVSTIGKCYAYSVSGGKLSKVPTAACPDSPVLVTGNSAPLDPWSTPMNVPCTVGNPDPSAFRYTCK